MACRAFHAEICNGIISAMASWLIILPANSMTTQLQKLRIIYYILYLLIIAQFFLGRYTTIIPAPVLNF